MRRAGGRSAGDQRLGVGPRDPRDSWGRLVVHRSTYKNSTGVRGSELRLSGVTFPAREFTQRRVGAAPRDDRYAHASAVMELGEAIQTAVDRGLPLLLSTRPPAS